MSQKVKQLPSRKKVKVHDTWDLASLFPDDAAWEKDFSPWETQVDEYGKFAGTLGESPAALAACLEFDLDFDRRSERLGTYALLKTSEDAAEGVYQRMHGRYLHAASRAAAAASYICPEILAISAAKMKQFLRDPALAPYELLLQRVLRMKPHTLGKKEERLLAMQSEMSEAAGQIFRQLNDADLRFGTIKDGQGQQIELSHAAFSSLLHAPARGVRRQAFHQYYQQYAAHSHTLAAALAGAMQRDVFHAKAREYPSALEAALFPDVVPATVYENLVAAVRQHLPGMHRYYEIRRRKMRLRDIHAYDTYVPILAGRQTRHTWEQAVAKVLAALQPLGAEYTRVLAEGFANRWCDRYENRGKQSGAFSCGSFDGKPYILMNYQSDVLDHVFTLAHEAGHSMHSYFSARHQPYAYYRYKIFVAEVASTFNEQLLSRYLLDHARDDGERAYLVNRQIDAIRGTIFRQTMFAEFEKLAHATLEAGEPLTLERFKGIYHDLLLAYHGPAFVLDEELDLECLRIPHFYHAFYVYKYATGMSAAIALADRVLGGSAAELEDYLTFLKGGCSKDPLDLLRGAGVDMERPEPVDQALGQFERLVEELDGLL